jgi:hypothetical protein
MYLAGTDTLIPTTVFIIVLSISSKFRILKVERSHEK